jgi:hypothetical protein
MIRSLRRRLWRAFADEDGDRACCMYQATAQDWEDWTRTERLAAEREHQENSKRPRRPLLNKILSKKHRLKKTPSNETQGTGPESVQSSPSGDTSTVNILQLYMKPSDPFTLDDYKDPNDSYDDTSFHEEKNASSLFATNSRQHSSSLRKTTGARQALNLWGGRVRTPHRTEGTPAMSTLDPIQDVHMTTPLHEAVRLGHVELVRLMLEHDQVDPDKKNGMGRTALHLVAGGLTYIEQSWLELQASKVLDEDFGIRGAQALAVELLVDNRQHSTTEQAKKAARAMGRFFQSKESRRRDSSKQIIPFPPRNAPTTREEYSHRSLERNNTALSLLSWRQTDDGPKGSSEGLSINAVDSCGRTALHYAAELGRKEICLFILTSFEAMLTIVDDQNRTPCDLAAANRHTDLADQLEARALLHMDPYGMDEILLGSVLSNDLNAKCGLAPPFGWFRTLDMTRVQEVREHRINAVLQNMKKILKARQANKQVQEVLFRQDSTDNEDDVGMELSDESSNGDEASSTKAMRKPTALRMPHNKDRCANPKELASFEKLHKGFVELYMNFHGWQPKRALLAFLADPDAAFQAAAIPLPGSSSENAGLKVDNESTCMICCDRFPSDSKGWRNLEGCSHGFCLECLGEYISNCAKSRDTGLAMICPHHECKKPLHPLEIVNWASSSDVYGLLIEASNENFIVNAKDLRYCPHPGCTGVSKLSLPDNVKTSGVASDLLNTVGSVCTAMRPKVFKSPVTYEGVCDPMYMDCHNTNQPPKAHRFCFACGEKGIHWPVQCERLEQWRKTIQERVQQVEGESPGDDYNDIAQKLWIKANTRPCPKCTCPIQKDEGCNHMTCSNPHCKHEFCWVCRNDWKLHNTETGGFFRCNRWVEQKEHDFYDSHSNIEHDAQAPTNEDLNDPRIMEAMYGTAMHEARVSVKRSRDMARFLHHYERWNAHLDSAALEQSMGDSVCVRLQPVVSAAVEYSGDSSFNFGGKGLSFVHAAFVELKECRSMLQHSYAFSFFRYNVVLGQQRYRELKRRLNEKLAFEQLQSELEVMTEQMSDVVARSRLRATQSQITYLTSAASEKRIEFSNLMINILAEERNERRLELAAGLEKAEQPNDSQSCRRLPGILDSITGLSSGNRSVDSGESSDGHRDTSKGEVLGDDGLIDLLDEALRASLEEFMANNGSQDATHIDDEGIHEDFGFDWPCSACTYMNCSGRLCAMCGTHRSS